MAKILVVDDDDALLRMIKSALVRAGHEVEVARDGNEAIQKLKSSPAELVLTDVVMPEKEGIQLMMELKRLSPDQKFVAMSGGGEFGFDSYLNYAKILGAVTTLQKPFGMQALLDAVARGLRP
jgi:DNA-binding NtrC family response regulator